MNMSIIPPPSSQLCTHPRPLAVLPGSAWTSLPSDSLPTWQAPPVPRPGRSVSSQAVGLSVSLTRQTGSSLSHGPDPRKVPVNMHMIRRWGGRQKVTLGSLGAKENHSSGLVVGGTFHSRGSQQPHLEPSSPARPRAGHP